MGTLTYDATDLPDGLDFIRATRTITGTPTTPEAPTVTYTVTDADGDPHSTTFSITVSQCPSAGRNIRYLGNEG